MSIVSKNRLIEALKYHEANGGSILDIVDSVKKEKSADELFSDMLHSKMNQNQDNRNDDILDRMARTVETEEDQE